MTYKNGTNKFTLSQKIVLLITFVIVASLLPASLLIAHRVSGVVDISFICQRTDYSRRMRK